MAASVLTDRAGFPMIHVEGLDGYLHWLPVTKIQFEAFLCEHPSATFDQQWYDEILSLNPRISPRAVQATNYWQSFITGITPGEAERYADWCGADYALLHQKEWIDTYHRLREMPPRSVADLTALNLAPRIRSLIERLDAVFRAQSPNGSLADQMFLRLGVKEWVVCGGPKQSPWGAWGQPNRAFFGSIRDDLEATSPVFPPEVETRRLHAFGFRLIRRATWRSEN